MNYVNKLITSLLIDSLLYYKNLNYSIRSVDQFNNWSVCQLSTFVCLCLAVCRCLLMSVYLCVCVCMYVCLSIGLSFGGLSFGGLSVGLYVSFLSVNLSVVNLSSACLFACLCLSICLSHDQAVCLSVCLSICLSAVGRSVVSLSQLSAGQSRCARSVQAAEGRMLRARAEGYAHKSDRLD